MISLAIIASLPFSACAELILELSTVSVHGIDVKLPKTLDENQVCVSFTKSSSKKKELCKLTKKYHTSHAYYANFLVFSGKATGHK
ncbi:MAG: hypothetical protein ACI92O_000309 [Colwellia sp.]